MTRREWLAWGGGALAQGAQARRPNVLMIAVDDLRPSLGCYGNPGIRSPNLDRLAASGMRFDHAYCQQAVCAPSRASLLSGTRPDTTRIYDLQTPLRKNLPDVLTLPQFFRQNGYETVALGKIYHHTQDDPEGWSVKPWVPPGNWTGKAAYLDPASLRAMEERDARLSAGMRAGMGPAFERPDVADDDYPDGKTATRAISELRRLKDRPFFLATGFYKPHLPFNAPKKYWDLYDPGQFPAVTQPDWPAGSPEVARSDWGELRSFAGMPATGPVSPELARQLMHGYAACVSFMDAQVGRVLAELESLGLAGNTIVVLWGDHGWKLNDYGAWCKHTNFEIDTHAPLLLRAPGRKLGGRSTPALVEFVDIYPTLAELCGFQAPPHCEGLSMVPLLDKPGRRWKEAAFSQYPRGAVMGYTLRSGRWRYTEWLDRARSSVKERELYDHSNGPLATRNLAAERAHAGEVSRLSALLDQGKGWRKVRQAVTQ
ncbi:MAG: sulfatase [Acidobacteria bacterium]|nr:sulfatase [Acidobacteriota bacterium]